MRTGHRWAARLGALLLGLVLATAACAGDDGDRLPDAEQLEGDDLERLQKGWRLDGRAVSQPTFQLGETHCEWEDALLLGLVWPTGGEPAPDAHRSFVRDPDGVMDDLTAEPFVPDAALPDDAVNTGYENDAGIQLWLAADLSTAFVVDGETVEAWPALGPWVCA